MSKFTPGPWFIKYADDINFMSMTVITDKDLGQSNNGRLTDDEENHVVAIVYHQSYPGVGLTWKDDANARLIAAAPDLYAALKAINSTILNYGVSDTIDALKDIARDALKKVDSNE